MLAYECAPAASALGGAFARRMRSERSAGVAIVRSREHQVWASRGQLSALTAAQASEDDAVLIQRR